MEQGPTKAERIPPRPQTDETSLNRRMDEQILLGDKEERNRWSTCMMTSWFMNYYQKSRRKLLKRIKVLGY